ncbi:MAG: hypothetical protein ACRDT6_04490 [Micromonosporaceae bacterium]
MSLLRSLFGSGSPLVTKLLAGLAVLVALGGLVTFAVVTFSGSPVPASRTLDPGRSYHWTGGTMVLHASGKGTSVACTITPEQGESRRVALPRSGRTSTRTYPEFEPWFTGAANVVCRQPATAYTGSTASLVRTLHTRTYQYGFGGVVAVLLFGAIVTARRRES